MSGEVKLAHLDRSVFYCGATLLETVYRGGNLSKALIDSFVRFSQSPDAQGSFQTFISTTRNRDKAEQFGNVLFIMHLHSADTTNFSQFFDYSNEEEELIYPGVCFTIQYTVFDSAKKKHLIYLNLAQPLTGKSKPFFSIVFIVVFFLFCSRAVRKSLTGLKN